MLEQMLEDFKMLLAECWIEKAIYDKMTQAAVDILKMSENILAFCFIFLDFVHPVWIQSKCDVLKHETVVGLKEKVERKLVTSENKLVECFERLTSEIHWYPTPKQPTTTFHLY